MTAPSSQPNDVIATLLAASRRLRRTVNAMHFADPVACVYNPLDYAWAMHEAYLRHYVAPSPRVLFLGMNPGPWGMAQTGIAFGEVAAVRDWLGLDAEITTPQTQHPARPVLGLACPRSEVSGKRLWSLFRTRFGTPQAFFAEHLVLNYCPLTFMANSGKNLTPDKLPIHEREPLTKACDHHLDEVLHALRPAWVIGVGGFAVRCAERVVARRADAEKISIGSILHPSPASPAANRDWAGTVTGQMCDLGLWERDA